MGIKNPPQEEPRKPRQGTIVRHPKIQALNRAWAILEPLSVQDREWLLHSLWDIALPAEQPTVHPEDADS